YSSGESFILHDISEELVRRTASVAPREYPHGALGDLLHRHPAARCGFNRPLICLTDDMVQAHRVVRGLAKRSPVNEVAIKAADVAELANVSFFDRAQEGDAHIFATAGNLILHRSQDFIDTARRLHL